MPEVLPLRVSVEGASAAGAGSSSAPSGAEGATAPLLEGRRGRSAESAGAAAPLMETSVAAGAAAAEPGGGGPWGPGGPGGAGGSPPLAFAFHEELFSFSLTCLPYLVPRPSSAKASAAFSSAVPLSVRLHDSTQRKHPRIASWKQHKKMRQASRKPSTLSITSVSTTALPAKVSKLGA